METHEAYIPQKELLKRLSSPQPTVIGIEGGPSGGKTTLTRRLQAIGSDRKVVCLPEAATEHILKLEAAGISVGELEIADRAGWLSFEADVLRTIAESIEAAKSKYAGTDTIIIADRCDIGAYVTPEEYRILQKALEMNLPPMLGSVDAVYYLPSLARLSPGLYLKHKASNPARHETVTRAQEVCDRNLSAIARHPELHIAWGGNFAETIDALSEQILQPEREQELKLRPLSRSAMESAFSAGAVMSSSQITQSYHELDGQMFRLRETVTEFNEVVYHFTRKQGAGYERHELQRLLSPGEYRALRSTPQIGATLSKRRCTVLVDDAADRSRRRAWVVDRYGDGTVHLETDVANRTEPDRLLAAMPGFEIVDESAAQMARRIPACR